MRQHSWTVQEVDTYESCRALTLHRLTQGGSTEVRRVIDPFDDVETLVPRPNPVRTGMRKWRAALRALIAEDAPATSLRTGAVARIDLLPYQLEPALALLHGLGSRLLIADDVGLGKTVQAMLALSELRARGAARRALIVCPAGLREQWADECAERFAMHAVILDQQEIRRLRALTAATVNPWTTEPLVIASIDYVKRPEVLPSVLAADWEALVVDEAHGAAGDSDRHRAVARVACRASYVMLLTATPHNGDESAFASLCDIGRLDADRLIVFRRSRAEVGRDAGRRTHLLRVRSTDREQDMHRALARLTAAVARDAGGFDRDAWLLLSLLHKRALSSAYALAASAERRLQLLGDDVATGAAQLPLPLDDPGGEHDMSDTPPMWGTPVLQDRGRERQLFVDLLDAARAARGSEGKIRRLRRVLATVHEPVIIFTEYRDTLLDLCRQLGRNVAIIHGGMSRDQRREALLQFNERGILLATDAAGEGLNLQAHCRTIVNLELPWNPMRLEQRIGRVDRIGQRRRVHVVHLVGADTPEVRLLRHLTSRVTQARTRVKAPNPFCGRPEWTDDLSARLILLNEESNALPAEVDAPAVPLTRLIDESEQESRRLTLTRAILQGSRQRGSNVHESGLAHACPLAAVARRWRLKAALQGRGLAVFKTSITDGSGRTVSTRIDAAFARGPCHASMADDRETSAAVVQSSGLIRWLHDSMQAHARMVDVRARRAASILASLRRLHGECQPGLFDQRIEREWQRIDGEHEASVAAAAERKAQADAAGQTRVTGPALALLLGQRQ